MKKKLFTLLTLLLCVCSGAWADPTVLFSTDFTDAKYDVTYPTTQYGSVTVNDGGTSVIIQGYKTSAFAWSSTNGITFTSNNLSASAGNLASNNPNYFIGIPLSGINGSITVTTTGDNTRWYYSYSYKDGDNTKVIARAQFGSNNTATITIPDDATTLYIGNNGVKIKSITITTPEAVVPGAVSFDPAAGSVAEGTAITLASSSATTILYQWGSSVVGSGGDWGSASTYADNAKPVVPSFGSTNNILSVKASNATGNTYGSATYTITQAKAASNLAIASGKATINKTVGADNYTLTQGTDFTTSSDGAISYTSSIPGVAYVNASTGELQFKGAGTTTITLTQAEGTSYQAGSVTFTVNVLPTACLNLGDKDEAIAQLKRGWFYDAPYFDIENKKVIISAYSAYSTANQGYQNWIATSMNTDGKSNPAQYVAGGTSNKASWNTSSPFIGGTGYYRDDTNPRHATTRSDRPWTIYQFRVKGITAAQAYVKGNNTSRYVTIAAYEITDGALAASAAKSANTSDGNEAIISVSDLDSNKEYLITVGNTVYASNLNFYEIAFTASASDIEIPSNRITTSAAGWASYTPMYNVSTGIYKPGSSTAATDIKMYTVESVTDGNATMHEVTSGTEKGMKANNGYFLKGAANTTYRTTATNEDVTVPATNLIKGQATTGTIKTEGDLIRYALLTYDADHYGLYKLNTTGVAMPAGKAYLEVDTSVSPSRVFDFLNFDFDGETTAIDAPSTVETTKNGVRKYIENGKLIIEKNGAKFNVAGAQIK